MCNSSMVDFQVTLLLTGKLKMKTKLVFLLILILAFLSGCKDKPTPTQLAPAEKPAMSEATEDINSTNNFKAPTETPTPAPKDCALGIDQVSVQFWTIPIEYVRQPIQGDVSLCEYVLEGAKVVITVNGIELAPLYTDPSGHFSTDISTSIVGEWILGSNPFKVFVTYTSEDKTFQGELNSSFIAVESEE